MSIMKKFVLVHHGRDIPTLEVAAAWNDWFQRRAHYEALVAHDRA